MESIIQIEFIASIIDVYLEIFETCGNIRSRTIINQATFAENVVRVMRTLLGSFYFHLLSLAQDFPSQNVKR